jgi:hypothetical protein
MRALDGPSSPKDMTVVARGRLRLMIASVDAAVVVQLVALDEPSRGHTHRRDLKYLQMPAVTATMRTKMPRELHRHDAPGSEVIFIP